MKIFLLLFSIVLSMFSQDLKVKITKNISHIPVKHLGQTVDIKRIQDPYHVLSDDYTKTSRACPPFCIHPLTVEKGVKTIAEVELMDYIKNYVNKGTGLIVDARLPSWYNVETIPSAINIPYNLVTESDKETIGKILELLGAKKTSSGYDFSNAKELIVFCNGVWDDQSTRLIKGLIKNGYPANKIVWYRDGFQGWKLLGLTTVIMDVKEVK